MNWNNHLLVIVLISCLFCASLQSQVGINTTTPDPSSLLDIHSTDKGILIPRIALTGIDDHTSIRLQAGETAPATGLLIYNTSNAGISSNLVSPGYYYYEGTKWARLHDEGFSLEYIQTAEIQADSNPNTFITVPGLDTGNITFPYAGIYKVAGNGYYSAGAHQGPNGDGVGTASLALEMQVNGSASIVKERFVSAVSLDLGSNNDFNNLGQQVSYAFSFEANTTDTYRFAVQGREWNSANTSEDGYFGKDSNTLNRANGQNDAFRGSLIITLIEQF